MKTLIGLRLAGSLVVVLLLSACATTVSETRENMLASSGFRSATASTAQEKSFLTQLPANQISKVQRNNEIWFVFPTQPADSALVGTQANYTAYLQRASTAHVQPVPLSNLKTPVFRGSGGTLWGTRAETTRIRRPNQ